MRKSILALFLALSFWKPGLSLSQPLSHPVNPAPRPLTTVGAIRALSPAQAGAGLPVDLRAVVTYEEADGGLLFVQDSTGGIYVIPPASMPLLQPGDEVLVDGVTAPNFSTDVFATEVRFLSHARLPGPISVSWRGVVDRANDCRYVTVTGTIRSATLRSAPASSHTYLILDLQTDGGSLHVHMDGVQGIDPIRLLDSKVKLSGVVGAIFDGKLRQTGADLWVSSAARMEILQPGHGNFAGLPLTDISRMFSSSYVSNQSQRVHVRGSVTLYQPGMELVVETPDRQAVLVQTFDQSPLRVGQVVDVVGFPYVHEYSEVINQANVLPTQRVEAVQAVPIQWDDAMAGQYPYNLISMDGRVAAEVHERHQDTLVIETARHVFSAILSRSVWSQDFDRNSLPAIPTGSTVRVTGVCLVHAGGPWSTEQWFEIQMRSPYDVTVLANPSWWTVSHLFALSAALLALVLTALLRVILLQSKVHKQTQQLRLTMESEAARERRIALLESERARVLEAINSMRSLEDVLAMILSLIASQLQSGACWCELAGGARVGDPAPDDPSVLLVRRDIFSGAGEHLGSLVLAGADVYHRHAGEVMEVGASLAALAIDTRRLYETLVHRSQYDQLTNAANRFLLESRLEETLTLAARNKTHFALIYIDLDQFKRVNDVYGHRIGDLLLQQVTERLSEKLRSMDTLARVGGDEFIALIPIVRSRAEAEEIAQRLLHAFRSPFTIEEFSVHSGASIGIAVYPEDGLTRDELQSVADTAMYARKAGAAD